jgi:peptidoglycan hydrolase-like protein with peptidoglycan-binding domain
VSFNSTRWRRRALAPLAVLAALAASVALPASGAAEVAGSAETGGAGQVEEAPVLSNTPFDRQGMWIWYVSRSEGGSVPAMIARAKRHGIGTVYVKSGDGSTVWNQFNKQLVERLHRGGIDVCAWQFVYGDHPAAEARVAAVSIERGADCFVIDAEADYEGKYAAADLYMRTLRAAAGETYPISLAGFPYVDYHPSYPYSVFLGPGGAQYNQPQMYWKTIGTSVRTIYEHTYLYNRIWGHPIYPIGQTYEAPGNGPLMLFRRFAASYGGLPPSWWDWQETAGKEWSALGAKSAAKPVTGYRTEVEHPLLKRGSKGDMVVWAQEHLVGAGQEVPITGIFGNQTRVAVRAFQETHGLEVDGRIGTDTWESLLSFTPERVEWAAMSRAGASALGRTGASPTPERTQQARRPLSASLPAKGYEIPPDSGEGGPLP